MDKGCFVRSLRDFSTGFVSIPKGTFFIVQRCTKVFLVLWSFSSPKNNYIVRVSACDVEFVTVKYLNVYRWGDYL